MRYRLLAIGLFGVLLPAARAQSADPATRELIERLLARIDGLERRVAELEKAPAVRPTGLATQAPASSLSPTEAMHLAHDQPPVPAMQSEATQPVYPSLKISGFADVDFSATTLHAASSGFGAQTLVLPHSGFEEGQFTLHLSSALSPKVTVFGELTFTPRPARVRRHARAVGDARLTITRASRMGRTRARTSDTPASYFEMT
jgi:hypothetical protein